MLAQLTQYLLQYKKVSIPHVGTFVLQEQSPEFSVADKLMLPPSYQLSWSSEEEPSAHQLAVFSAGWNGNSEKQLAETGRQMAEALESGPFQWNGIARLTRVGGDVQVHQLFEPAGLNAVPAHKVIREHAVHQMLVGDRETDTGVMTNELAAQKSSTSWPMIVAWVLLALAVIAILVILYEGNWQPGAAGLKPGLLGAIGF